MKLSQNSTSNKLASRGYGDLCTSSAQEQKSSVITVVKFSFLTNQILQVISSHPRLIMVHYMLILWLLREGFNSVNSSVAPHIYTPSVGHIIIWDTFF